MRVQRKWWMFLAGILLLLFTAILTMQPPQTNAVGLDGGGTGVPKPGSTNTGGNNGSQDDTGERRSIFEYNDNTEERCNVPTIGWIICQVSYQISKLIDWSFQLLQELLETTPLDRSSQGGERLYDIWNALRSVANVVFVFVVLAIILSQTSNFGLTNYNIKRMLPRLIVSIVMVNASFYIGLIILDVANIIGRSLYLVLGTTAESIHTAAGLGGVGNAVGVILVASGAIALIFLSATALLPMLVSAIITLCLVILFLVARQAVMIALVVISPIAFALNILPGTQKWFSKWWSAMLSAAMVYPIVAIIFGGSMIAANIIRVSPLPGGELVTALLGIAVQVLPFTLVPKFMKMGGSLMNQISSVINKPDAGVLGGMKRGAKNYGERRDKIRQANSLTSTGRLSRVSPFRLKAKYNAHTANANRRLDRELSPGKSTSGTTAYDEFIADNEDEITEKATTGIRDPQLRNQRRDALRQAAVKQRLALDVTSIDAAETELELKGADTSALREIAFDYNRSLDSPQTLAAIRMLGAQGEEGQIHELIQMLQSRGGGSQKARDALADGIESSGVGEGAAHLSGGGIESIRNEELYRSDNAVGALYNQAASAGKYSPEVLSRQSSETLHGLYAHRDSLSREVPEGGSNSTYDRVTSNMQSLQSNPKLHLNMSPKAQREMNRW